MISVGDCRFDPETGQLFDAAGQAIRLRNKSLRTLAVLADPPGRLVGKDEIIARVWDQPFVSDESLAQCIADIRKSLGDSRRVILQTVPGRGFLLEGRNEQPTGPDILPLVVIEEIVASPQDEQASLIAERISLELLQAVSRRRGIRVKAGARAPDSADYLIRGRVRVIGNRLLAYLEIDEVNGRGCFYTETFELRDETAEDFASRVSRKVTNVQRVSAIASLGERLLPIPDTELGLQQLLQKAAYHYARITVAHTEAAKRVLTVAHQRFPESPMALAMLAATYVHMYPLIPIDRSEARVGEALALAEQAVTFGPNLDFTLRTRGNVKLWLQRDHEGARGDCRRALAITPNYQLSHLTLAQSSLFDGDGAAARARLDRHIVVDIALPQYLYFQTLYALCALVDEDADAAKAHAREAFEFAPGEDWSVLVLAAVHGAGTAAVSPSAAARLAGCGLRAEHFDDLPIRDRAMRDMLVSRARAAGL